MTTRSEDHTVDDEFWRRPAEPSGQSGSAGSVEPTQGSVAAQQAYPPHRPAEPLPGYAGPPPSMAPPPGWRPPVFIQPPPPRQLPHQDLPALDADERRARILTYQIALVAGAVLLVATCLLFSRIVF